ncbi:hypothetical protein OSB04_004377 [Centaurea solstitialis]|uniref:Uncharacterized protein n=1 Tax=Centaurea solstitialis TaxID=347529 RepID=A0AA38U910_9ASTR|nr:hypothetical protein OSB04_004377 [Centaurea solstitialis]
MMMAMSCKDDKGGILDNGKYVRYTPEQVEALERLYHECPKPSSIRRQQLIRECPILSNIEPKQIKVWFQNRRCREKQRRESSRLQGVNRKLTAMNKLLMEENDDCRNKCRIWCMKMDDTCYKDTSCESVVTSHLTQNPPQDASPAGLLSIAEETLTEFLSKATGTAVEWVQMPGMKPGPDSIGIVAISHGCTGVAARACGLVGLEPTRVAEILKDRPSWYRDCRAVDVVNLLPTANGGTIELLYMQLYAPTTLATARDFWLLRYTSATEDGSLVVCERSLTNTQNGPSMPAVQNFVRAEMLRAVTLFDLVKAVVRSFTLHGVYLKCCARCTNHQPCCSKNDNDGVTPAEADSSRSFPIEHPKLGPKTRALRALSQRLSRGFNEALNGFSDEGWSLMGNDGMDDVTILVNSSPEKLMGLNLSFTNGYPPVSNAVLCAKASMLLQHRSEWADNNIDAYSAAAVKLGPCSLPGSRIGNFGGQLLEVIKLEGVEHCPEDSLMPRDMFLLQLCSGMDENAVGMCAELIFAPIDSSFADDAPLLPSGFRIIPLDSGKETSSPNRTLDLASALEIGGSGNKVSGDHKPLAAPQDRGDDSPHARKRSGDGSSVRAVHRGLGSEGGIGFVAIEPEPERRLQAPMGTPEAHTLARWICHSYRCYLGVELLKAGCHGNESILKSLWHHSDAILCCSLKALPVFTFANQAGLDMLETTLVALQDITLEKILDEHGRKSLCTEFPQIMQQGFACLQGGICLSSMGRPVSYERAVAWKVLNEEENAHCICFMFINCEC